MKKSLIPATLLLVLAIVISLGSRTFLSPCIHQDGIPGPCHWAGRMELELGVLLGILALLSMCVKQAMPGTLLSAVPVCVLGILTPGTIIDICHMSTMRCRMLMQPAMILLFSAALLCALIGILLRER